MKALLFCLVVLVLFSSIEAIRLGRPKQVIRQGVPIGDIGVTHCDNYHACVGDECIQDQGCYTE